VAISDTYINLKYFDSEGTREIHAILIEYVQAVIDDDWLAMANDQLGQRTSALKRQFTEKIIELKPANSIQKELRSQIIADVDNVRLQIDPPKPFHGETTRIFLSHDFWTSRLHGVLRGLSTELFAHCARFIVHVIQRIKELMIIGKQYFRSLCSNP